MALYALASTGGGGITAGIYTSADFKTWTYVAGSGLPASTGSFEPGPTFAIFNKVLYLLFIKSGGGWEAWTSTNNGATWTLINSQAIAGINSLGPVYFGTDVQLFQMNNALIRSTNFFSTFTTVGPFINYSGLARASDGTFMLVGSGTQVYTSSDGSTWTLQAAAPWQNAGSGNFGDAMGALPQGAITIAKNAAGSGPYQDGADAAGSWTNLDNAGSNAITVCCVSRRPWGSGTNQTNPDNTCAGLSVGSATANRNFKTTNGGNTWTDAAPTGETPPASSSASEATLFFDPISKNFVMVSYTAGHGVAYSTDGFTWTKSSTGGINFTDAAVSIAGMAAFPALPAVSGSKRNRMGHIGPEGIRRLLTGQA